MLAMPVRMSEISAGKKSMSLSLVASFAAHAALLLAVAIPSVRERLISPPDSTAPQQAQTWAGTTAELPSGETLYDVQLTGQGAVPEPPAPPGALPAPPAEPVPPPPAPPAPPAETSPKEPPPSPPPTEPARPAPKPESPPKPEAARPKPAPAEKDDPYEDVSLPPKPAPKPAKEPPAAKPAAPKASAVAANTNANPKQNPKPAFPGGEDAPEPPENPDPNQLPKSGLGGAGTSGGSFGAAGRAGVRDLGAAFTQAIPAACGADMTWSEIDLGDGGTVRIALDIDENGRVKSFSPLEKNPPKQLQNLAKRTFGLLQSGTFALRPGAVTAGRQTVEVSATVGMTDKPATSGGLIELSHAFENGVGRAHFVQTTGREVRFKVRVIRIEVTAAPAGDD